MTEVLPYCKHTEDKSLTILVVGKEHIIQPLSASLVLANDSTKLILDLKVHQCENVKQVVSSSRPCAHVDYIAFCIDSRSTRVLKEVEEQISYLNKIFLLSRMCLVLCLFGGISGPEKNAIINFRAKYQMHQLNGRINQEENHLDLSTRLLRLVVYATGLKTGYPVVEHLYKPSVNEENSETEEDSMDASTMSVPSGDESSEY